jgi:hypothetical protein
VRIDHERIADGDLVEGDVFDAARRSAVRHRRNTPRQRSQDRGGAPHCVAFEGVAARQHQHDDRAG